MPIYAIDVKVWATAYIKADSEESAMAIAKTLVSTVITIESSTCEGDLVVSDAAFHDLDFPALSLSPMMTIAEPADDEPREV